MRRSRSVLAPILAGTALSLLTACRRTEMERCVDSANHVVDPKFCQQPGQAPYTGGGGGGYYGIGGYHYYYGGSGSYTPGTVATEGSTTPASGHSYSTSSGTSRGGFGSSFGFGGGEGGGE